MTLKIPEDMVGHPESHELAEGPFAMEHNGLMQVGSHLEQREKSYFIWDGSRLLEIDPSYAIKNEKNQIWMRSEAYESTFVLRPLREEDAEWAMPDDYVFSTLDALKADLLDRVEAGY